MSLQAAIVEIVNEEPGSTSTDVRAELLARGIPTSATATVATALARLVAKGVLIRQEMPIATPKSRRAAARVVLCYRPNPDHQQEADHGPREED